MKRIFIREKNVILNNWLIQCSFTHKFTYLYESNEIIFNYFVYELYCFYYGMSFQDTMNTFSADVRNTC